MTGTTRRAGYRVLAITGPMTNVVIGGETQRARGTATLYVTTSLPHLPVEYTQNGKIDKVQSTLVMTFSRWGEIVNVTAPQGRRALRLAGDRHRDPPDHEPTGAHLGPLSGVRRGALVLRRSGTGLAQVLRR